MQTPIVVLISTLAAACVVALLIGRRPSGRAWFMRRWITQQDAPITPEVAGEVSAVRWRTFAGMLVGAMVGLLGSIPSIVRFDPSDDASLAVTQATYIIPFALMCVGAGIGGFLAAARDVRGPVRVASTQTPRLSDSVHWSALLVTRVQMALLIAAALAATRYDSWTGNSVGPLQQALLAGVIVGLPLVWVVVEVVARRLVAAPQPSADAISFFWRDAVRGDLLRQLWGLPAVLGLLVPPLISGTLPRSYGTPAQSIGPDVVLWISLTFLVLYLLAQGLLKVTPRTRRRAALLREAQLEMASTKATLASIAPAKASRSGAGPTADEGVHS